MCRTGFPRFWKMRHLPHLRAHHAESWHHGPAHPGVKDRDGWWRLNYVSYCYVHSMSNNPHVSYLSGSKNHVTLGWEIWGLINVQRKKKLNDWPNLPCSGPATPDWNPSKRPSLSLGDVSFANREEEPGWKNMAGKSCEKIFWLDKPMMNDDLLQLQLQDLFGIPKKNLNTQRLPKIFN